MLDMEQLCAHIRGIIDEIRNRSISQQKQTSEEQVELPDFSDLETLFFCRTAGCDSSWKSGWGLWHAETDQQLRLDPGKTA